MHISKFKFPVTKYSNENLNAKSSIRNTHSFDYALLIEGGIYIKNNYFYTNYSNTNTEKHENKSTELSVIIFIELN